jgi:hypothetical protein
MNIFPNNALWTTNHELRTFEEELHFSCTIFSPESKCIGKKAQMKIERPVNFTYFNREGKTEPFLNRSSCGKRLTSGEGYLQRTDPHP